MQIPNVMCCLTQTNGSDHVLTNIPSSLALATRFQNSSLWSSSKFSSLKEGTRKQGRNNPLEKDNNVLCVWQRSSRAPGAPDVLFCPLHSDTTSLGPSWKYPFPRKTSQLQFEKLRQMRMPTHKTDTQSEISDTCFFSFTSLYVLTFPGYL